MVSAGGVRGEGGWGCGMGGRGGGGERKNIRQSETDCEFPLESAFEEPRGILEGLFASADDPFELGGLEVLDEEFGVASEDPLLAEPVHNGEFQTVGPVLEGEGCVLGQFESVLGGLSAVGGVGEGFDGGEGRDEVLLLKDFEHWLL